MRRTLVGARPILLKGCKTSAKSGRARNQSLDGSKQDIHVENGLGHVVIKTRREILLAITNHSVCRQCDNRKIVKQGVMANEPQNLGSIHFGKRDIQNDNIGPIPTKCMDGVGSTGELFDLVLIFENSANDQP